MSGARNYAYDFACAQPCTLLRIELRAGALGDVACIDAWLTERLAVDRESLAAVQAKPQDGDADRARAAIERALLIYGELARAANFPCFDPGRLIRLEPPPADGGSASVTVAVPVIDHVPQGLFSALFEEAYRAMLAMSRTPPASAPAGKVIDRMEKVIAQAKAHTPTRGVAAVPICQYLHRHDVPFRHIGGGYIRAGVGSGGQLLKSSTVQSDSAIGAMICSDKRSTARVLLAAGLPGARHVPVRSGEEAQTAARQMGWPVVVKPADRERSEGVTINISSDAALLAAFDQAREISPNLLVERHVPGTCHRILVAADKVLYVVKRMPKRVVGNGRETIAGLVEAANAKQALRAPWKRLKPLLLDDVAIKCLAEDGFEPASVLAEGQAAFLRPLATPEWGGEIEDLTKDIHPDNVELAILASRLLGLRMAGVDLITTDIREPWHQTGAVLNEINFKPQFMAEGREMEASTLVEALTNGGGRIPVHLVTGSGDRVRAARALKSRLSDSGREVHWVSSEAGEGPHGRAIHLPGSSLFERSLALTMRPDVHELIILGGPGELDGGLAVDRLESLHVVETDARAAARVRRDLQRRFPARSAHSHAD